MQAQAELDGWRRALAIRLWYLARWPAVAIVRIMAWLGLHKQVANRLLEPWLHMTVIVSATDWENFFAQRAHPDAQPEFQSLAYLMLDAINASIPRRLQAGQWHLPFGDRMPAELDEPTRLKVATARLGRTSYVTFDGEMDALKDMALHDGLEKNGHWSPFEHVAQAMETSKPSGNFTGFRQYRKAFPGERRRDERLKRHHVAAAGVVAA